MPVVGEVVAQPIVPFFTAAQHDVAVLGHAALQAFEVLAVVADLDQKIGLGMQRELGVHYLVTVVAEFGRPLDAPEEVGVAEELAVEECRLVDDLRPSLHRLERAPIGCAKTCDPLFRAVEFDDVAGMAVA